MLVSLRATTTPPTVAVYKNVLKKVEVFGNTLEAAKAAIERFDNSRQIFNGEATQIAISCQEIAKEHMTCLQTMDEEHAVKLCKLEVVRKMPAMSTEQDISGDSFTPVQIRRTSKQGIFN